jgi:murein DD-endopeptidase MepM/ murein hydrolase activator NlpD
MKKKDSVNGRIIKIRHNSTYSSAYAHMNSFASGMATGIQVKQGQIIGYVGRSGRATGPHLHFAMYRNGRYVDPRRVNVPRASSVPKGDMEAYLRLVDEKIAILASSEHETVFSAKDSGLMTKD